MPSVDKRERDACPGRRMGTGDLALGLHQPGEARRRDPERQRDAVAEHSPAGVDLRDVAQDRRVKLDVAERLPGPGQRQLLLGGAVGVVERRFRRAALGDSAQVVDGQRRLEPRLVGLSCGFRNCSSGASSRGRGSRLRVIIGLIRRGGQRPPHVWPGAPRWPGRCPATATVYAPTSSSMCSRSICSTVTSPRAYADAATGSRVRAVWPRKVALAPGCGRDQSHRRRR